MLEADLRTNPVADRESYRYFTPTRAFIFDCFPGEEDWAGWLTEMMPLMEEDFYILRYTGGTPPAYTAESFFAAATGYFRHLQSAEEISQDLPSVPVLFVASTIRDLATLQFPDIARRYDFKEGGTIGRAKRILGLKPRTHYQETYQEFFRDNQELDDPNSEIYHRWANVLMELRNRSFNQGQVIDIDYDKAIELVKLVSTRGYSFKLAAATLELTNISERLISRVYFISLYALRHVLTEFLPEDKIAIPLYKGTEKHWRSAAEIYDLSKEKDTIDQHIEENLTRLKATDGLSPYLNPLQLYVLKLYVDNLTTEEMLDKLSPLGLDENGINRRMPLLKAIVSGRASSREVPYRAEFRQLILQSLLGNDQILRDILQQLNLKKLGPFASDAEIVQVALDCSRSGTKVMGSDEVKKAIAMRLEGRPIRQIAKQLGYWKGYIQAVLLTLEMRITNHYFPSLTDSWEALFFQGNNVSDYLRSHQAVFLQEPADDFTEDERTAWYIARRRAQGTLVNEIVAEGYSEQAVSAYTHLALITVLKYGLNTIPYTLFERKDISRRGRAYPLEIDSEANKVIVNGQNMELSPKEYTLLSGLLEENGRLDFSRAYEAVFPGQEFINAEWQRTNLLRIVRHLQDRLGADNREEDFVLCSKVEQLFSLNPQRFDTDADGNWKIYYGYSPFGAIRNIQILSAGRTILEYADGHDRKINLSDRERRVLQVLYVETAGDWISVKAIARQVFLTDDERKIHAVYKYLTNLKRKLCIQFPRPGHILSDNAGNYRIINYEDLFAPKHVFWTSQGIFAYHADTLTVYDAETEEFLTHLTLREGRTLRQLFYGSRAVNPQVKSLLRKKLLFGGVVTNEGPIYRWENDIQYIGYQEELDWRDRLKLEYVDGQFILKVFHNDSVLTFTVTNEDILLLDQDPMDPTNFASNADPRPVDLEEIDPAEDIVSLAIAEASAFPRLSPSEEMILLVRMDAGDPTARRRLFRSNMRLAVNEVRSACRRSGRFDLFMDFLQEAYQGIEVALDKFDIAVPGERTQIGKFSTYAVWWIRQKIGSYLKNQGETIRKPIPRRSFESKVKRIRQDLMLANANHSPEAITVQLLQPRHQKIIAELGLEPYRILSNNALPSVVKRAFSRILNNVRRALSDSPIASLDDYDERDLYTRVPVAEPSVEDYVIVPMMHGLKEDLVQSLIALLSDRDAAIIKYRFGLEDGIEHTLAETGEKFGLTKERIRQIENASLLLLRQELFRRDSKERDDLIL